MFCHADVVCFSPSCGSSQCCILHDLQFVNAGLGVFLLFIVACVLVLICCECVCFM